MEKIKTAISGIASFLISSLFPVKKILIEHLEEVNDVQQVTFQTYSYQLLIIYGFVFAVSFIGIYALLISLGVSKKD